MIKLTEIYKMELEKIGNTTVVTNIPQIPTMNNTQQQFSSQQNNLQNERVIQEYQKVLAKKNQSRKW